MYGYTPEHEQELHVYPTTQSYDYTPATKTEAPVFFNEVNTPGAPTFEQHGRPVARQNRISAARVLWAWKWELLALVGGLGLFAAMLVILLRQNNHAGDDWTFFLNLNSLIALLSTFYRAVMVAVAAEVVSQSKWVYFWSTPTPMPLLRLQYFDSASRGIWGAIRLLPYTARRSPIALAATLILGVSFTVGPFIQQSIGSVEREFPLADGEASLPIARNIDGNGTYYRALGGVFAQWDFKYETRGSVLSAVSNPLSNDSRILPDCTSGNCTFPRLDSGLPARSELEITHGTVGMCHQCFDVGSLLQQSNTSIGAPVWKLPNDVNVTAFDRQNWMTIASTGNLTWAEQVIPEDQAAKLRWAFANVTVLALSNSDTNATDAQYPLTPRAVVCSLYPCLRQYSAAVSDGRLNERLVSTKPMYPDATNYTGSDLEDTYSPYVGGAIVAGDDRHLSVVQSPCLIEDVVYGDSNFSSYSNTTDVRILAPDAAPSYPSAKVPAQCVFQFNTFFHVMLGSYLQDSVFSGACTWDSRQGPNIRCGDNYWLAQFWELKFATVQTIMDRFDNIAEAVTRQFRLGLARDEALDNQVRGTSLRTKPFTVVELKWLIFPIALLAIETMVLVWMIGRSVWLRGEEMVWKGNLLPLLYHRGRFVDEYGNRLGGHKQDQGLSNEAGQEGTALMTLADMEEDAKNVKVRLVRGNEDEWAGNSTALRDSREALRQRADWDRDSLLVS